MFLNTWKILPVKPLTSNSRGFVVGRLFFTADSTFKVNIGQFRFSISSYVGFGKLYLLSNAHESEFLNLVDKVKCKYLLTIFLMFPGSVMVPSFFSFLILVIMCILSLSFKCLTSNINFISLFQKKTTVALWVFSVVFFFLFYSFLLLLFPFNFFE